jgi:two-component system, chemotaxis family, CheB/CheR fusion protein
VIFSVQNLITEPPFSRLDLISCRNVLIYLEPDIQKKIIALFSFALRPGGYLFLGKSDGLSGQSELFAAVSSKWRIYRSQGPGQRAVENFLRWPEKKTAPGGGDPIETPPPALSLTDLNLQVLAKHFDVAIVLTDERGNILYFCGPTRKYLDHPTGQATLNLLNLIDSEFSARVRLMLRSVAQENEPSTLERIPFKREDSVSLAKVTIMPAPARKPSERLFAVLFEEVRSQGTSASPVSAEAGPKDDSLIAQLEAELKALKDEFRSTIDEYESSAEELKAANEEVMSINEELQSTNEELETSKEEIQAVNEELNTVNNELSLRMTELKETNDDLANLLNASDIGMIFLNSAFCIKRFTPSAQKLLNLMPGDLSRPISHLSHRFGGLDLVEDAGKMLQNLSMIEKEVQSTTGEWYEMHCLPYRTLDNKIDGVIFTFTDVTRLKRSEEALLEARNYAENIIHTTATPLVVLNPELEIVSANRAFYETFQVMPEETEKCLLYNVGNRQWNIPRLRQLLETILPGNTKIDNFEVEHDFPRIGRRIMSLNASKVSSKRKGEIQLILLSIDDITDHKQVEAQGRQLSRELEKGMSERAALLEEARQALAKESEERKALEEHLHHAQRMESMGVLAGGIAHDFNNLLNIIQGYASILSRAKDDQTIKSAKAIVEKAQRGAGVVRQLLALARKTNFKFEVVQVNDLIQALSRLLKETFPKNIEVSLDLAPELPQIRADPNQITQVLLNISVNARDAMPNGGRLTLKSETVDGQNLQDHIEATAERIVRIEIIDTGIGMDETVQNRIFDPFFTTKELGKGTGLGLAVAYGIMKSHNGWIRVESRPAQGTTFWLYLPVVSNQ